MRSKGPKRAFDDMEAFPFTWPILVAAGTDPKVLTPSDLMGGVAAGEEDMGAETSSIDQKVTGEPIVMYMFQS